MASVDVRTIVSLLREYAQRTALRGGNPYRAKAYTRAADSLAALAVPLDVLIAEDRLTEIPGVGEAIADIILKLHKTGSHPSLEKLRKEIPEGVLEMLAVPGLRPEKVLRLYKDLGITSLAELEAAAKNDRIKKAKGLGAALQAKIDRYEKEKTDIQIAAQKLEAEATAWDHESEAQMHQHHRWAQATTVLQVSIALAAIALLTRKKWLEYGMLAVAGAGLLVGAAAALHL